MVKSLINQIGITLFCVYTSLVSPGCNKEEKINPPLNGLSSTVSDVDLGFDKNGLKLTLEAKVENNGIPLPSQELSWVYALCFYPPNVCVNGGYGGNLDNLRKGNAVIKRVNMNWSGNEINGKSIIGRRPTFTISINDPKNALVPFYEGKHLLQKISYK